MKVMTALVLVVFVFGFFGIDTRVTFNALLSCFLCNLIDMCTPHNLLSQSYFILSELSFFSLLYIDLILPFAFQFYFASFVDLSLHCFPFGFLCQLALWSLHFFLNCYGSCLPSTYTCCWKLRASVGSDGS